MATLEYNGYASLRHVKFDSYTMDPVYAEDGISQISTRHELVGTALIVGAADTDASFTTELKTAKAALLVTRADLVVNLDDAGSPADPTELISITAPDDFDGPQGAFKITQIIGIRAALVTFTVRWTKYEPDDDGTVQTILSHRWVQKWEVDANDLCTHTVSGTLVVRASAAASTAAMTATAANQTDGLGNNPDVYRNLVVPALPEGWRRESMEFATDETGNRLLYNIVSRQGVRDIPAPARTGNASFHYRQSLESGGSAMGVKVFEIELAAGVRTAKSDGYVYAPGIVVGDLLAAAVKYSRNFIKWTGQGGDLVKSIEVSMIDMFTDNRIRFRVTALNISGTGTGNGNGTTNIGMLSPPNVNLTSNFLPAGQGGYQEASPYGGALIRSVRRALFKPTDTTLPKAQWEHPTADAIPTTIYTFPADTFEAIESGLVEVADTNSEGYTANHQAYPYLSIDSSDRVQLIDSGLRALKPQSLSGPDIVMQVHRPRVLLIQEANMIRHGAPPDMGTLRMPSGGIVRESTWNVQTGNIDANGNITFIGNLRRVVELTDQEGLPWWNTLNAPAPFGFAHRAFYPPDGIMARPYDPRTDVDATRSVFENGNAATRFVMPSAGLENSPYFADPTFTT